MKVISRQRNSKFCLVCGLDNPFGIRGAFYNMEDGRVMSPFQFHFNHQSYPQRVHGGTTYKAASFLVYSLFAETSL